ncbi:hypothetical protein [Alicyclobacillus pomorum]|uniref:hypothetical protein n=1 Tax=Alicyclobacillus pomorum TaxID=204470 RepID=UPI0039EEA977
MKKSICALSTVLLTASAAAPFVLNTSVAYADDNHGKTHVEATRHVDRDHDEDNQKLDQLLTMFATAPTAPKAADDKEHAHAHGDKKAEKDNDKKAEKDNDKKAEKDNDKKAEKDNDNKHSEKKAVVDTHKAQLNQLHAAIDQLHKDQKAEQAARQALLKQGQAYVQVMEQAIASGNATAVQAGNQGIQTILTDLKKALSTQADEDKQVKSSMEAGKHGDLARALQAVRTADNRVKAKTAAMQKAADELKNLVATLKSQLTSSKTVSGSTSGASASGSSRASTSTGSSKAVTNEGNTTITINN